MSEATDRIEPPAASSRPERLERLRVGVEAASATYLELDDWEQVAALARSHGEVIALAPSLATARPDLAAIITGAGARVVVPDGDDPAAAVADVPVAIVAAELAIAESGSLLVAEHALGDRVVTMLCQRLIQVVAEEHVVDRLEAAADWLSARAGQPGFASLMTGPSRTADIERSLTIGVQGPDVVDVVVLRDPDGHPTSGDDHDDEERRP